MKVKKDLFLEEAIAEVASEFPDPPLEPGIVEVEVNGPPDVSRDSKIDARLSDLKRRGRRVALVGLFFLVEAFCFNQFFLLGVPGALVLGAWFFGYRRVVLGLSGDFFYRPFFRKTFLSLWGEMSFEGIVRYLAANHPKMAKSLEAELFASRKKLFDIETGADVSIRKIIDEYNPPKKKTAYDESMEGGGF